MWWAWPEDRKNILMYIHKYGNYLIKRVLFLFVGEILFIATRMEFFFFAFCIPNSITFNNIACFCYLQLFIILLSHVCVSVSLEFMKICIVDSGLVLVHSNAKTSPPRDGACSGAYAYMDACALICGKHFTAPNHTATKTRVAQITQTEKIDIRCRVWIVYVCACSCHSNSQIKSLYVVKNVLHLKCHHLPPSEVVFFFVFNFYNQF